MRYYLDTEFDGLGGPLLSLALVQGDGKGALYWVSEREAKEPWVVANVAPFLESVPFSVRRSDDADLTRMLGHMLAQDADPHIISDWPDDLRYLMAALITGPGEMVQTAKRLRFTIARVDAYPTRLEGAVQHNAWWDAYALRELLEEGAGLG